MLLSSFTSFVSKIQLLVNVKSFWKAMLLVVAFAINQWSMMAFMMFIVATFADHQKNPFQFLFWFMPCLLLLFVIFQIVFQLIEFMIEKTTDGERSIQLTIEGYIDSMRAINIFTLILMPFRFITFVLRKCHICLV